MTGIERQYQQTKATPLETREAILAAWRSLFGTEPSKQTLCVLLAQWALETGRGKACFCWNLGNMKYPGPPVQLGECGDWQFYACNEIIGGKTVWFYPPNRGCCFQAFGTLTEGCIAYLGLLARRYAKCGAWDALVAGDPSAYSKALKRGGYYTAAEADWTDSAGQLHHGYTWSVISLFHEFSRLPDPEPEPSLPMPSGVDPVAVAEVVARTMSDLTDIWPDITAERDSLVRDE
jgi:hypothetical protein